MLDFDSELKISDELTTIVDGAEMIGRDDRMASMLKSILGLILTVLESVGFSTEAFRLITSSCGNLTLPTWLCDFSKIASP